MKALPFLFALLLPTLSLAREEPIAEVVEKVSMGIVNIRVDEGIRQEPRSGFLLKSLLGSEAEEETSENLGSGVVVNPSGLIVTNEHLVSRARTISVKLMDGREFEAEVIATDPEIDIALLKVPSEERLPHLKLQKKKIRIGQRVVVIGNPLGLSSSVTQGVVSAIGRNLRIEGRVYTNLIQTDAAINPGNSGGALLDLDGNLIGIVTAIYGEGKGIGFAIPIDEVMEMLSEFEREKRRPFLGLFYEKKRDAVGFCLYVRGVVKKSPAEKAGVRNGDAITRINGSKIQETTKINRLFRGSRIGDQIRLSIRRGDKSLEVVVPTSEALGFVPSPLDATLLGVKVEDIRAYQRLKYRLRDTKGVVITRLYKERPKGVFQFRPGDVITGLSSVPLSRKDEFEKLLVQGLKRNYVLLHLKRGEEVFLVPFKFDNLL